MACICILTGCGGGESAPAAGDRIIVACGDDTAGLLVKSIIDSYDGAAEFDAEAQQVGDCCGSNSQFALSTGEVDVAIVCPDAIQFLPDDGEGYTVVGTVTYDSIVLVRKEASESIPASIGYMNNRSRQVELLRGIYGDNTELKQMYASGLSYALENEAVEAVVLDAMTALALGYPFERISEGEPSSVMVVRNGLLGEEGFLSFVQRYNEEIDRLSDSAELDKLLSLYLEQGGSEADEEVASVWQEMGVSFGKIELP